MQRSQTRRILPADDEHVDAVLPFVSPQIHTMIELQRLTGMRPQEVIQIRPADVMFRTDGIWTYRPRRHKVEHHDLERIVHLGPQAQELLRPWLNRHPESYCFSPREVVEQSQAKKRAKRKTRVQPSQRDRSKPNPMRKPGGATQKERIAKQSIGLVRKPAYRTGPRINYGMVSLHWFAKNLALRQAKSRWGTPRRM